MMARPLLLALVLALVSLAGCIGGGETVDPEQDVMETEQCLGDDGAGFCGQAAIVDEGTGRDLRVDLTADDQLHAPVWQVGDVFEQHIYYGQADTSGEHIQTMVVDDTGSCYDIATTSENAANFEAAFNLPMLGCIDKNNLETGFMFNTWDWMYDFPIHDGKSWTGQIQTMINWNDYSLHDFDFTLQAIYDEAIDTPRGDFPGFWIEGRTSEGDLLLYYNYVPAVGWFSHFWMYDLGTEDPSDIILHMMSMGTSKGFTGTYYQNEGHTIMNGQMLFPVQNPDWSAFRFDVDDTVTTIKGVMVPIACGTTKVVLNTPGGQQHQYDHINQEPVQCPDIFTSESNYAPTSWYSVYWVDEAAETGTYTITAGGAGVYGYYGWLTAIVEVTGELTEDDLPMAQAEAATAGS